MNYTIDLISDELFRASLDYAWLAVAMARNTTLKAYMYEELSVRPSLVFVHRNLMENPSSPNHVKEYAYYTS